MKSLFARILMVVAVVSLIANVLLYLRWSTSRPLVTIGSEVITRKDYQDQLNYEAGESVMKRMVLTDLILQAASHEGVSPTQQDVDARIAMVARRSPQLLVPFSQDPIKMDAFRQSLLTKIALENLEIKDVKITPAEVKAYYAQHQSAFALPEQIRTLTVVTQNSVDAATATDLLRQNMPPDVLSRQPRLAVVGMNGYNPPLDTLSPAVKQQISDALHVMKTGEVRTFHDGGYYLTFRINKSYGADVPPLAQIQDQVTRMAKQQKGPSDEVEIATLYQTTKPEFHENEDRYAPYFDAYATMPLNKTDSGKKTASVP